MRAGEGGVSGALEGDGGGVSRWLHCCYSVTITAYVLYMCTRCPILSVLSTRFERWWCLGFYSIAIVKIKGVFLFSSFILWTLGQFSFLQTTFK